MQGWAGGCWTSCWRGAPNRGLCSPRIRRLLHGASTSGSGGGWLALHSRTAEGQHGHFGAASTYLTLILLSRCPGTVGHSPGQSIHFCRCVAGFSVPCGADGRADSPTTVAVSSGRRFPGVTPPYTPVGTTGTRWHARTRSRCVPTKTWARRSALLNRGERQGVAGLLRRARAQDPGGRLGRVCAVCRTPGPQEGRGHGVSRLRAPC